MRYESCGKRKAVAKLNIFNCILGMSFKVKFDFEKVRISEIYFTYSKFSFLKCKFQLCLTNLCGYITTKTLSQKFPCSSFSQSSPSSNQILSITDLMSTVLPFPEGHMNGIMQDESFLLGFCYYFWDAFISSCYLEYQL